MSSLPPIQFKALTERKEKIAFWHSLRYAGILLFLALIAVSYFVLGSDVVHSHAYVRNDAVLGVGEILGLFVSVYSLLHSMTLKNKLDKRTFENFVKDNSWSVAKEISPDDVASILTNASYEHDALYALTGKHGEEKFTCLIYQYLASVADHSKTKRFICLHLELSKPYPMIAIMNLYSKLHISNLPVHFTDESTLDLEGDFSKKYQIKTTKGSEQETLEVLTPDVMEALEDLAQYKVDIEISDKDIYLIYEDNFYSEHNIASLFTVAGAVLGKLGKLSKTWMASSKFEEQAISRSALAVRYKQLSKAQVLIYLVTVLLIFGFTIYSAATNKQYQGPSPGVTIQQ